MVLHTRALKACAMLRVSLVSFHEQVSLQFLRGGLAQQPKQDVRGDLALCKYACKLPVTPARLLAKVEVGMQVPASFHPHNYGI